MAAPPPQSPPAATIRYRMLGPLSASRVSPNGDTAAIELGAPKQRAVLALLLLSRGRIVSIDQFVDALWGDAPPPSAAASLQAYISNLRRLLRPAADAATPIVLRGPGYLLDVDATQVDLTDFTEASSAARRAIEHEAWDDALTFAQRAATQWPGGLLDDFRDEPWIQADSAAVEELRSGVADAEITALLALGRAAPAIAAAQRLHAAHPLRDRGCWLHMIALHVGGRSPEALDGYREHVARLDDLGLEPGTELRDLEVAILRHDPELAAWPRPAGWTGAAGVATPHVDLPPAPAAATREGSDAELVAGRAPLVGRAREREAIEEALGSAAHGHVRWLLLSGPAGIGKTRLAEALVWRSQAIGGRDAWSRCSDEDGAPAWWPIRQIVRALGDDLGDLLAPASGIDADEARFALYERVAKSLMEHATRQPLVVVVDDVQWADRTSVRCLAYLTGALRGVPIVVALTLREGEDQSTIAPLLAALARTDGYRQFQLGPLTDDDVAALTAEISGEALAGEQARELADRTGGNPLFVSELARLPAEARAAGNVPLAVRSVLGRRLESVAPAVLDVLRPAAVLGDPIDIWALSAVTGQDADHLADLLDVAADQQLIVPSTDGAGYAFSHGLLRDEILTGMPALRLGRWHARIAASLAGATDPRRIDRRAHHLLAAHPLVDATEVLDACRAAARVAEERWSPDAAADWWGQALRAHDLLDTGAQDPAERDDLVAAWVSWLARAGRGQRVLEVLDRELLVAVRAERPAAVGKLAAALVRSAGAWPWTAYGSDPRPVLERLDSLASFVAGDPAADARLHAARAVGHCYDPDPRVAAALSDRALTLSRASGDPAVRSDAILGRLVSYSGVTRHAAEALALTAELEGLHHAEAAVDRVAARSIASMAAFGLGDPLAATGHVRAAIVECERLGMPVARVQLRWMQGTLAQWEGKFDEARRHFAIAARAQTQSELAYDGSAVLAGAALARDEHTLLTADLTAIPERAAWAAAVAAARGDAAAVASHAAAWLDALHAWTWITLGHVVLVAHACADARLPQFAPRLLELLAPYAGEIATVGQVGVHGPVDLAAGRLRRLTGDDEDATALITGALALCERTGGVPWAERCRQALATPARP